MLDRVRIAEVKEFCFDKLCDLRYTRTNMSPEYKKERKQLWIQIEKYTYANFFLGEILKENMSESRLYEKKQLFLKSYSDVEKDLLNFTINEKQSKKVGMVDNLQRFKIWLSIIDWALEINNEFDSLLALDFENV